MTDKKITQLNDATTLDGSELIELVQAGANVKVTVQAIANLGGGGAGANKVGGCEVDQFGGFATPIGVTGVNKSATGVYDITFQAGFFTGNPVFAATSAGNFNATGTTNIPSSGVGGCQVRTFVAGVAADMGFNLIAIAVNT